MIVTASSTSTDISEEMAAPEPRIVGRKAVP